MASEEERPIPPVPLQTNPILEDEQAGGDRAFNQAWARWFTAVRAKINVINTSLANLGGVSGTGILIKNGAAWITRTIQGTAGRVTVTNGTGAAGDPTIDLVTGSIIEGVNVTITGDLSNRLVGSGNITIAASGGGGGGGVDPRATWEESDDLTGFSGTPMTAYTSAGGLNTFTGEVGHPGVFVSTIVGTAAASTGFLKSTTPANSSGTVVVGGGVITFTALINLTTLLVSPQAGQARCGLMDEISGAPTVGIHLQYDSSSPNWLLYMRNNGTNTFVDSGIAATTGWHVIKIVISALGDSVSLFLDGVSIATATTNIPTDPMKWGTQVQKTAGTAAFSIKTDYIAMRQDFTTNRW